ncbi:hypothetical protein BaRGS_00038284 [Batillaria attramentaria]|uniref:Uncharacterized protein n=1 Tax=Batillaria attramentaria TaxID=370345 RepID=A0ABD0J6B5_9CAEN
MDEDGKRLKTRGIELLFSDVRAQRATTSWTRLNHTSQKTTTRSQTRVLAQLATVRSLFSRPRETQSPEFGWRFIRRTRLPVS